MHGFLMPAGTGNAANGRKSETVFGNAIPFSTYPYYTRHISILLSNAKVDPIYISQPF